MDEMSNRKQSLCTDRQTAWTLRALLIGFVTIGLVASSCATRTKSTLPTYNLIASPVGQRCLTRPSQAEVDSLVAIYGHNKSLLPEYSDILVVALSYYPELQSTHIKFEYSSEQTTMASRPASVFPPRRYKIVINNDPQFKGIPFDSIPYNAAVGIVGHELAHIVEYETKTLLGLLDCLLLYSDKSHGKVYFEKTTDLTTIQHGLGWQLYDWAKYAMYDNQIASEEYKAFKQRTYLSPDEIEQYIRHYAKYATPHLRTIQAE